VNSLKLLLVLKAQLRKRLVSNKEIILHLQFRILARQALVLKEGTRRRSRTIRRNTVVDIRIDTKRPLKTSTTQLKRSESRPTKTQTNEIILE